MAIGFLIFSCYYAEDEHHQLCIHKERDLVVVIRCCGRVDEVSCHMIPFMCSLSHPAQEWKVCTEGLCDLLSFGSHLLVSGDSHLIITKP